MRIRLTWVKTTTNKVKYELNQGAGPEGLIIQAYIPRTAFGPVTMYPPGIWVTVDLPEQEGSDA
jgi:hypothetical protein